MKKNCKLLVVATLLCCTNTALAVDGVIEINQARALAGSITATDTPGFPVTLGQSGSYRLTGNLTLSDINTTAIDIRATDVSIDLNGFGIFGIVECTGIPISCNPSGGSGIGISATSEAGGISPIYLGARASVFNGTIRGMSSAIILEGPGHLVEAIRVSNGDFGILVESNSRINACTVTNNGNTGISVFDANIVSGNTVSNNGTHGIVAYRSGNIVTNNSVSNNIRYGIALSLMQSLAYGGNFFSENNGGNANPQVIGNVVEIAANVCGNDTTCP